MKPGEIITYIQMVQEEGFNVQRGMNFSIIGKEHGVILMSVRKNAPYADRFEDNGNTIIYEGHDVQSNFCPEGCNPKEIDQPMTFPSGELTENGKFYNAAMNYKSTGIAKTFKVYEKIKSNVWKYKGYFRLSDAWIEKALVRNVFKFKLEMIATE